uniref:Uncharacterized protein n=2 Tax=Setaria italica TaxID=4555 RepID=K3ZCT0_SETIT
MAVSDVAFQSVWRSNCAAEFSVILNRVRRRPRRLYISVDQEFCGGASVNPLHWPQDPENWYDYLSTFVHAGDVLQIGLALALEQPPGVPPEPVMARSYHPDTITFLLGHGHDLTRHKNEGVLPELACAALLRELPFGDPSVTWIWYHGDKDVAFLFKLLQRSGRLPPERHSFLQLVHDKLPSLYDVKVMAQVVQSGYKGGLRRPAGMVRVERIGNAHQASSDAILTMACFSELCKRCVHAKLLCRRGLLSGLEQIHPAVLNARSIDDKRQHMVVEVKSWNFDDEARRITELVPNNFSTIMCDVTLPGLSSPSLLTSDARREYELVKGALTQRVEDIGEVILGFANAEGLLGWGCLWKFSFDLGDAFSEDGMPTLKQQCAPASKFWALMAACGALHHPGTMWLSCHGGYGFAWMINFFLSPLPLPKKLDDYVQMRAALWPSLYDVALIAHWCADVQFRAPGCKGKLLDLARSLTVPVAEDLTSSSIDGVDRALLLLKCFRKVSALPEFSCVQWP